ncbi:MAG: Fic family protein [Proteobacteria bacterium]|nr:Fic family protein [Pseudomonadota bacterium]
MTVKTKTGQIIASHIKNCPVFIPNKLISIPTSLKLTAKEFSVPHNQGFNFDTTLSLYFYKFFAGDRSLTSGFADIAIVDLYLWQQAKIAKSVYVKAVVNAAQRFAKVVANLSAHKNYTQALLLQQNKALRPKDKIHGIRTGKIRAGNPNNNSHAFWCTPVANIVGLFADFIEFINSDSELIINKALLGMMQFIYIHPFKDGNGRTSRALFITMMSQQFGLNFACIFMLYLKNINRMNYYAAMQDYRNGDVLSLKRFYLQALGWVNDSLDVLHGFFTEYSNKIGHDVIASDENYSQVIVQQALQDSSKLNPNIFALHSNKGSHNIYINTALLNTLNQLDYYLRSELRKHRLSYTAR